MTIYNQIMLRKNKDLYGTPLGQLVEVDGHNMSIYTEGEGEHTIVFMSGWGTTSPILDFKCLYSNNISNPSTTFPMILNAFFMFYPLIYPFITNMPNASSCLSIITQRPR